MSAFKVTDAPTGVPANTRPNQAEALRVPAAAVAGGVRPAAWAPSGAPLGKETVFAATAGQDTSDSRRDTRRADRLLLRRRLAGVSTNDRVKVCGKPGGREDGSVTLRLSEQPGEGCGETTRVAGFGGLFSCGNVWLCPVCSVKIASKRAEQIEQVVGWYVERGGTADLTTLTMRHHKGDRLKSCWDAISDAWSAVTTAREYRKEQKRLDCAGFIRAVEVTVGPNGWHVHVHAIFVYRSWPLMVEREERAHAMFERWSAGLVGSGFQAPDRDKHGLDVKHLDWARLEGKTFESIKAISEYVAKGLAMEATLGAQKEAKNGNRTTMQLLRDAVTPRCIELGDGELVETLDRTALALWEEYERAAKGKKQLTWSKELRELRNTLDGDDQSDEEIAETEIDGETVAVLPRQSYERIEPKVASLLATAEHGGREAAQAWLNDAGIEWYRPTGLSDARCIEYQPYDAVSAVKRQ